MTESRKLITFEQLANETIFTIHNGEEWKKVDAVTYGYNAYRLSDGLMGFFGKFMIIDTIIGIPVVK